MARLVLTVPMATPALNTFVNKTSRWSYVDVKRAWYRAITQAYYAALAERQPPWVFPPGAKVRVVIARCAPAHQHADLDGAYGGAKPAIDALKVQRFIDDDAPTAIDLVVEQVVSRTRETRITLER